MKKKTNNKLPLKAYQKFLNKIRLESFNQSEFRAVSLKTNNAVMMDGLKRVDITPKQIEVSNPANVITLTVTSSMEQMITTNLYVQFNPFKLDIRDSFTDNRIDTGSNLLNKILSGGSIVRKNSSADKRLFYFLELKENGNSLFQFKFDEEIVENAAQFSFMFKFI